MSDSASDIFAALAHPTRRQILQDLKDGELAAGEIAARFSSTGPTISRHLSVLRQAGLVTERRDANRILYSLVSDRLALSVGDFLSTVCPEQKGHVARAALAWDARHAPLRMQRVRTRVHHGGSAARSAPRRRRCEHAPRLRHP
jgi:DNA-binding transcriptional ArsR family regulator